MDEKLTPADVIRKGIDAVADAENKGLTVEKDADVQFSAPVEDDAVEFSSFSIEDNRDTTPGSKAGTRLPTVSMPSAKVLDEPVSEPTRIIELPEGEVPVESEDAPKAHGHSRTWLKRHGMLDEGDTPAETAKPAEEPTTKSQDDLLAEILADTPDQRRRKEMAKEEGRQLVQEIFSEERTNRHAEEVPTVDPSKTRIVDGEEYNQDEALAHFLEMSKRERRESEPKDIPISQNPQSIPHSGGYFGVERKSGFKKEYTDQAAGGRVIESRNLAVDPTTLSKKELREYNRINKKGDKEREKLEKRAAKKNGKRGLRVWQKVLIVLLALILLVVGVAGVFFGRYYGLLGDLDIDIPGIKQKIEKLDMSDQSEANEQSFNILLVGLDSRKDNYTGRSDSMILCTINKKSKKFVMTSFLRDSWVDIPGYGKDKLNAAYALGGSNLLTNTIYENYGIAVDRTAVFNFLFVIDVIDYLGGVTVDVTAEELPYLNMYIHDQNEELYNSSTPNKGQITSGPGRYTLTGNQALGYARIRYVGTDVARTERQRVVLDQCLEKCRKLSASELNEMASIFLPRIKTDLSSTDCASLMVSLLRLGSYETLSMSIPVEGTWKDAKAGDQDIVKITNFEANTKAWETMVS